MTFTFTQHKSVTPVMQSANYSQIAWFITVHVYFPRTNIVPFEPRTVIFNYKRFDNQTKKYKQFNDMCDPKVYLTLQQYTERYIPDDLDE